MSFSSIFTLYILWTIDQCWNILEPTYFGFNIEGILLAANVNTSGLKKLNTNGGPTYYTYSSKTTRKQNTGGGYTIPDGSKTVEETDDTFDRWSLVADHLTTKIKGKLTETPIKDWTTIRDKPPIKDPLIISSVMASLSFLGIFIGLLMGCFIETLKLYMFVGIIFSIFSISSILCGVLRANDHDKVKLKAMTFSQIEFQYKGKRLALVENSDSSSTITPPTQTGEITVLATEFSQTKNHFYIADDTKKPKVEIKSGTTSGIDNQTEGIAKANIIAVIGIFHCLK